MDLDKLTINKRKKLEDHSKISPILISYKEFLIENPDSVGMKNRIPTEIMDRANVMDKAVLQEWIQIKTMNALHENPLWNMVGTTDTERINANENIKKESPKSASPTPRISINISRKKRTSSPSSQKQRKNAN